MTKTKVLHGVLIDPGAQTITDVTIAGHDTLRAFYSALGCDCIDIVQVDRHHNLIVDDEGLFKEGQKFFSYGQRTPRGFEGTSPLAGKALLLGFDRGGNTTSARLRAAQVTANVYFLPDEQVRRFRDAGGFDTRISAIDEKLQPTGPVDVIPVRPTLADEVPPEAKS